VVMGGFGCGGEAGANDAVAFPSFEMDDVEHSSGSGEADRCESLFGGGTGFDVIGWDPAGRWRPQRTRRRAFPSL
jgi:hypothetical protein